MGRNLKRLFYAALISLTFFVATNYWYHQTNPAQLFSNQQPVAFVENTKDEIQRRSVSRIIWQIINDGEPVYPGEAIRTSSEGEVRIQFLGGKRFIDLEPDSLIVISQSADNEISLDLMDGGLQVSQSGLKEGESAPGLSLKSGKTKVDLSTATASLSKTKSGQMDLQVLKGTATVETGGKTTEMETGDTAGINDKGLQFNQRQIQILSPLLDQPTFIRNSEKVVFSWKGTPAGARVVIHSGANRKNLVAQRLIPSENKAELKLLPGKHFWKLVVLDAQSNSVLGETPVYKLEVASMVPPSLLSPAAGARIFRSKDQEELEFQWTRSSQAKNVFVEISSDPLLKNKILSEAFDKDLGFKKSLPDGEYYVRLSSFYDGASQAVSGKITRFYLGSKAKSAPKEIQWTEVGGTGPQYFVEEPTVQASWDYPEKNQVKFYRVKIAESEEAFKMDLAAVFETKDLQYKAKVKKAGRYLAMVEAISDENSILAVSPPKSIEVASLPVLSKVKMLPEAGDFQASKNGRLDLQWEPLDGASSYLVVLLDSQGKEIKKEKHASPTASIANLLPGQFQIQVLAVDKYGRPGEKNESRKVLVPESSGLSVPKFRRIKVK